MVFWGGLIYWFEFFSGLTFRLSVKKDKYLINKMDLKNNELVISAYEVRFINLFVLISIVVCYIYFSGYVDDINFISELNIFRRIMVFLGYL